MRLSLAVCPSLHTRVSCPIACSRALARRSRPVRPARVAARTIDLVGGRPALWAARGRAPFRPLHRAASVAYWLAHRIVETLTGIGITKGVTVGGGLRIYHFGGIFIADGVRIGSQCTLRQGVTIGERHTGGPLPVLGDKVDIGQRAGAWRRAGGRRCPDRSSELGARRCTAGDYRRRHPGAECGGRRPARDALVDMPRDLVSS